jgi:hypothetical protein
MRTKPALWVQSVKQALKSKAPNTNPKSATIASPASSADDSEQSAFDSVAAVESAQKERQIPMVTVRVSSDDACKTYTVSLQLLQQHCNGMKKILSSAEDGDIITLPCADPFNVFPSLMQLLANGRIDCEADERVR